MSGWASVAVVARREPDSDRRRATAPADQRRTNPTQRRRSPRNVGHIALRESLVIPLGGHVEVDDHSVTTWLAVHCGARLARVRLRDVAIREGRRLVEGRRPAPRGPCGPDVNRASPARLWKRPLR